MANATIPMLTQAVSLIGDEQLEAVQAGSSVRVTAAQIAALGGPTGPTGPSGGPTGPTGSTGPTGPAGAASGLTAVLTANLPSAVTAGAGAQMFVTDSTVTTFAALVAGGGGNGVPVFSDGSAWRVG